MRLRAPELRCQLTAPSGLAAMPVLVTGFSNIAIDNIAAGLLERGVVVVRAGRGATKLDHIALHNLVQVRPEWAAA